MFFSIKNKPYDPKTIIRWLGWKPLILIVRVCIRSACCKCGSESRFLDLTSGCWTVSGKQKSRASGSDLFGI